MAPETKARISLLDLTFLFSYKGCRIAMPLAKYDEYDPVLLRFLNAADELQIEASLSELASLRATRKHN